VTNKNQKHQPPETRPQPEPAPANPQEAAVETTRESVKTVPARSPEEIEEIEEVKGKLLKYLKDGEVHRARNARANLGQGIDLPSIPGYAEAVKAGFLKCLKSYYVDKALQIRSQFGQGIDFSLLPGYADAVRACFLESLIKDSWLDDIFNIRDELGQGIDFSLLPGYVDAVRAGFLERLRDGDVDRALKVRDELGQGIDFSLLPGYADAVRAGFLERLRSGYIDDALKIRNSELGQGIDFTSHPGYPKALVAYAKGKFPDFRDLMLGEGTDIQKFRDYKNKFWLPEDKAPSGETLLDFEALTCLAGDLVREEVKRKIRGLGYDTEAPGFSARQMAKGHALEAGRFREEVESRIRARFHAFASPALFDALKRRSGDEMKWVA